MTSYHGWTHAPKARGGTDPIDIDPLEFPWVTLVNTGQTLPGDNAFDPSIFDQAYWDPALVSEPNLGNDTYFDLSTLTFSGTDYWSLTAKLEGWYLIDMAHGVDIAGGGGAGDYFQQSCTVTGGTAPFSLDSPFGNVATWVTEIEAGQWIETTRVLWLNPSCIFEPEVRQNTGLDKGVEGHLKVFYLGGVGGGTDNTAWEVALA